MNFTSIKLNHLKTLLLLAISIGLIQSCMREEKAPPKSMEELHKENGVPVEVQIISSRDFHSELSFFSKLSGIKESTVGAAIGGKVKKINSSVGKSVRENQIIVEFPTDEPIVQYDQAYEAYENSKLTLKRMKALLEAGEISQQMYDNTKTQHEVNKRNFEAQKQLLMRDAPIDGVITEIYVNEGDIVKGNDPLFTVAQLHKMRTKIWVSEKEIGIIKEGMTAKTIYNEKEYTGKVVDISLSMDLVKQAFYVEIEFDNSKRELKSGVTNEFLIETYNNENSIIIPRNLINSEGDKKFVYLDDNNISKKRYIETGNENGMNVEILNGLKVGDRLIVKGINMLEDGKKIDVVN